MDWRKKYEKISACRLKQKLLGKRSAFRDQLAKKEMIFIIVIPWAVCA